MDALRRHELSPSCLVLGHGLRIPLWAHRPSCAGAAERHEPFAMGDGRFGGGRSGACSCQRCRKGIVPGNAWDANGLRNS